MLGTTNLVGSGMSNNQDLTIQINGSNVLTYNGESVKNLDITLASLGAAASDHNHYSVYSSGLSTALTGDQRPDLYGISMVQVYDNGYPELYGNVIRLKGSGCGEILCGWSGQTGGYASLYYRNQRDYNPGWSDWVRMLDSTNFTEYAAEVNHTHTYTSLNTSGADYAEYFQWVDSNTTEEDRVGYFVTLEGNQIKIASPGDYILGVISSTPSVIGNSYDDQWHKMELSDDWGRPIPEEFTEAAKYAEIIQDDGTIEKKLVKPERLISRTKINPDYNNKEQYIGRSQRAEWDPVGMLGVLRVRDDNTCIVNGYCTVADGGIATISHTGWRVIERVADNIIKIVFK